MPAKPKGKTNKDWSVNGVGNYEPTGRLMARMANGTWAEIEVTDSSTGKYYRARVRAWDRTVVGVDRKSLASARRDCMSLMKEEGVVSG